VKYAPVDVVCSKVATLKVREALTEVCCVLVNVDLQNVNLSFNISATYSFVHPVSAVASSKYIVLVFLLVLRQMKNPVTSSRMKPTTSQLVA
jgi:hypothetical protein